MKAKFLPIMLGICLQYSFNSIDLSKIEGWKALDEALTYNRENLWEYIDGAADLFLSYGFEQLTSQEFSKDSLIVVVDVYDMGKPLNAFGIYSAERPAKAKRRTVGTEAVISPPYQALMVKDRFYIKVNVSEGKLNDAIAYALLRQIAKILPGLKNYPQEFSLLPGNGLVPFSYNYSKKNFSGLSELNNCISAEYQSEEYGQYTCFAAVGPEKEKVEAMWKTISEKWKKDAANDAVYYRKIPYKGYVGVIRKNNTIMGISGIAKKERLLKMLERLYGSE